MATVAAVLGLIAFFGEPRIRDLSDAWLHAGANVLAVLIELYNFYMRYAGTGSQRPALSFPSWWCVSCSSVAGKAGAWSTSIMSRCHSPALALAFVQDERTKKPRCTKRAA